MLKIKCESCGTENEAENYYDEYDFERFRVVCEKCGEEAEV